MLAALFVCSGAATASAARRAVTIDDMSSLRRIDTLRLSPDREQFALLILRADAAANDNRLTWFVGNVQGAPPIAVGDGGDARLSIGPLQSYGGFEHPTVRWSPDGHWIAYTVARDGETQLWRSRTDGGVQEQLTRNAADVREFEWNKDGTALYFSVGTSRAELRAREQAKERGGYQYDSDFRGFTDLMGLRAPPLEKESTSWIVSVTDRNERLASESERSDFQRAQALSGGAFQVSGPQRAGAFAERADGARAVAKLGEGSLLARMELTLPSSAAPIPCVAEQCRGFIERVWWRDDKTVLFTRREGIVSEGTALYAWVPKTGSVVRLMRVLDDSLQQCELAAGMQLICARDTPTNPPHVAAIDAKSGRIRVLADVNPEFQNIALGKVERFEWDTPKFPWNAPGARLHGVYPERAYGYILYPPDFDASRRYPVFINPYSAVGFDNISNQEYALHVLAAQGFVVLSVNSPTIAGDVASRVGPDLGKLLFSAELGFPHLSMYMESAVQALDTAVARGWIDEQRVGIGSVSQGSAAALYMLMKHDRLAAVSIAGGAWSQLEYYYATQRGQSIRGAPDWFVKPVGPGLDFWKQLELADNVDSIEAPILINTPATETFTLIRLMRHMAEAGKPYDAYVFPQETHIKWQAAHLHAAMRRNVDWFRFWLQGYEDPDPTKAEQYARWRKLRELKQKPPVAPSPAAP